MPLYICYPRYHKALYVQRLHKATSFFQAIGQITFDGGKTNIADGLRVLRTQLFNHNGDRPEAPNIALVITDGGANINEQVLLFVFLYLV